MATIAKKRKKPQGTKKPRKTRWLIPVLAAAIMLSLLIGAYVLLKPILFGVDIRIEPALTGIYVAHPETRGLPGEDFIIPYISITSLEPLQTRPNLTRVSGFQGRSNMIGTFQAEGLGKVVVYASNYRDPNTVFIKVVAESVTYLLTPSDPWNFYAIVKSRSGK